MLPTFPKKHSRRSGGYLRRSTAHFSDRQRSPLRKSFMPSQRQKQVFGGDSKEPPTSQEPEQPKKD
jgi:hypothetical protein